MLACLPSLMCCAHVCASPSGGRLPVFAKAGVAQAVGCLEVVGGNGADGRPASAHRQTPGGHKDKCKYECQNKEDAESQAARRGGGMPGL